MPYPSSTTYPGLSLYPGLDVPSPLPGFSKYPVAIGDIVLNAVDSVGTEWVLENFDGWGSPAGTLQVTQRARGDGGTESESFLKPRVMTLTGQITVDDPDLLSEAEDALIGAVTLEPFLLRVAERDRVRWCYVRRQDAVITKKLNPWMTYFSIQVVAKDPLKYGDQISKTTSLPSVSGGLTYPITYPITYTGVTNTGIIHIDNPGNKAAPIVLRVDGPIPAGGWSVTHQGKGATLTFATSLALAAGEYLTIDMQRREVLAQGVAARNGYVTSRGWFDLDPGPNDIAFTSQVYDPNARLTVTTTPAWS